MKIPRIFVRKIERRHVRRNVKDRLFRYIFEKDRSALLQLYNALNGTDYQKVDELKIMTMENVIYLSMKNDLAFSIAGLLNLYEQQSSYNPNMPVRFLIYLGQEYQKIVTEYGLEKLYGSELLRLPTPRCVVFYNGETDAPEECVLRLSDAYEHKEAEPDVELKVRMININFGHNQKLMEKCHRLWEYAFFVDQLNRGLRSGIGLQNAAESAIEYCIGQGVLEDILTMGRREVLGMILSEYNEKKVQEYLKKEAKEIGYHEGWEEGRKQGWEHGQKQGLEQGREEGQKQGLEQGRKQGLEQGLEQGIAAMIRHCCRINISYEEILQEIEESFQLEHEKAVKYMNTYWNSSQGK